MSVPSFFFRVWVLLAPMLLSLAQSIPQAVEVPSNLSLPNHLLTDDPRFGLRGNYGEESLNIISLLMNTVDGLANLAFQPNRKRISGFHVEILPWFADLDISVQPAPPAVDIEVHVVADALYFVVYDMIKEKTFKNANFDIIWDSVVVGLIQIKKTAKPSTTISAVFDAAETAANRAASPIVNDTTRIVVAANTSLFDPELRLYYHYLPDGEKMTFQQIFVTLMAALKNLGRWPSTQVVEPFRTGARGFNAKMQFYGEESPRSEPPFLTYGMLIDTVRQIAFHLIDTKKFAELQTIVTFDDEIVGEALLEVGSPELSGPAVCGGNSGCNVTSS